MSELKKKAQVIMLPTNEASKIHLSKTLESTPENSDSKPDWQPQHLYIVSDDEIKEGSWVLIQALNKEKHLKQVKLIEKNYYQLTNGCGVFKEVCKKIIATTDNLTTCQCNKTKHKLSCKMIYDLPKLSQSFIEKYISQYNKGNVITDVMVEYADYDGSNSISNNWNGFLKVNSSNEISITKVKDSWSREEVKQLFYSYNSENCGNIDFKEDIDEWLIKNL